MTSYFIFILFFLLQKTFCYDCTYPNSLDCNNRGKCTKSGTCLCDLYYYGVKCENGTKTIFVPILLKKKKKNISSYQWDPPSPYCWNRDFARGFSRNYNRLDVRNIFPYRTCKNPFYYKIMVIIFLNLVDLHFLLLR